MNNARVAVPPPRNEPILGYAPGSAEKTAVKARLTEFTDGSVEIPLLIGGREVTTGDLGDCILPHDHQRRVATYHRGNADTVDQAIAAAAAAHGKAWGRPAGTELLGELHGQGARLLAHGGDFGAVLTHLQECVSHFEDLESE